MAEFKIKIAGHTAKVTSLFESTPQYFKAYLTEDAPEFSVTVSRENIVFEQADLLAEAHRDGFKPRVFTDPFLERAAIQRSFSEFLFDFDILLLHGSGIAVDGAGYLFTAHSGTGKSTHTRYWQQVFGSRAVMVNDDKPFVQLTESTALLHGSPWSGKHGLDTNIQTPLQGICLLERGSENTIQRILPDEILPMLRKQCYCPLDPQKETAFLALTQRLAVSVPAWRMTCTKDPAAAQMAHDTMSENSQTP